MIKNKKSLLLILLLGFITPVVCAVISPLLAGRLAWAIALAVLIWGFLKKKMAKAVAFMIGVVMCHVVAVVFILAGPAISDYIHRTKFESSVWKEAKEKNGAIRVWMVDDLLSRHTLVGKTREEITAMLGAPTKTDAFSGFDAIYWLGPERGFISIDSEWLGIRFKDDVAVEAQILRD